MYNLFQFDFWYIVKHVTSESGLDFNSLKEFFKIRTSQNTIWHCNVSVTQSHKLQHDL